MSRSHSFSVDIATIYGVEVALMLNHFSFWYLKNKSDSNQFFKGEYWVRMKASTLREYYPYFTLRQLRYLIDKMIDLGLLKQDEFNDKKNDRTKWYTVPEKSKKLLGISTDKNVTNVTHKIVTPTDKNVTSIYKEEDIKDRYSIYIDFPAIIFIIKNAEDRFQTWEMQNKKSFGDYIAFLKYFEIKVEEEELEFTVNKLLGRLKRLAFNWNKQTQSNFNTSITPTQKAVRIN